MSAPRDVPTSAVAAVRERTFFVTHIGMVSVNDRGTVIFEANSQTPVGLEVRKGQPAKVIVHADTIADIHRGVKDAMRDFKREGKQ